MIVLAGIKYIMRGDACAHTCTVQCYRFTHFTFGLKEKTYEYKGNYVCLIMQKIYLKQKVSAQVSLRRLRRLT